MDSEPASYEYLSRCVKSCDFASILFLTFSAETAFFWAALPAPLDRAAGSATILFLVIAARAAYCRRRYEEAACIACVREVLQD